MELHKITEEEVKHICKLAGEPYIDFMVNDDGKWDNTGLEIQISTTTTLNKQSLDDTVIWIKKDGTISLWRNNGNWGGSRYAEINALPIIDYLRERGYAFYPETKV